MDESVYHVTKTDPDGPDYPNGPNTFTATTATTPGGQQGHEQKIHDRKDSSGVGQILGPNTRPNLAIMSIISGVTINLSKSKYPSRISSIKSSVTKGFF